MTNDNKKLVLGAGILGLGTFIAKLLGAIYRIPLTRILKSEGIGIYQMVFPVYALLLIFRGVAFRQHSLSLSLKKASKNFIMQNFT